MRVTTSYKPAGTKSFRLSAAQVFERYGCNLQNPPEALLRCLEPTREGYCFGQIDQSGAEALIVAHEVADGNFRELFRVGIKPHVYMALQIFLDKFRGEHPRERYQFVRPALLPPLPEWPVLAKLIKNSPREYGLGKKTIHAKGYGMRWPTFQLNVLLESAGEIVLSAAEAKLCLNTHEHIFPEVVNWQGELAIKVHKERIIRNLFGYPRRLDGRWNDETEREALSWIPQSTVGVITHKAIRSMNSYIAREHKPWLAIGNKHDSMAYELPTEDKEEWKQIAKQCMEIPLRSTTGVDYQMKGEVSFGMNLGKWHEQENPEGMKEAA